MKKLIIFSALLFGWWTAMVGLSMFNHDSRKIRVLTEDEIESLEHDKEIKEYLEEHPEERSDSDSILLVTVNQQVLRAQQKVLTVSCTVYNPVSSQCWGDPLITADGSKISKSLLEKGELRWIAVSRDILKVHKFKFGDKVKLTCEAEPKIDGVWEIHDTMHERWRNKIDLLQPYGKGLKGKWSSVKLEKV